MEQTAFRVGSGRAETVAKVNCQTHEDSGILVKKRRALLHEGEANVLCVSSVFSARDCQLWLENRGLGCRLFGNARAGQLVLRLLQQSVFR